LDRTDGPRVAARGAGVFAYFTTQKCHLNHIDFIFIVVCDQFTAPIWDQLAGASTNAAKAGPMEGFVQTRRRSQETMMDYASWFVTQSCDQPTKQPLRILGRRIIDLQISGRQRA
jgi:hypothetical protein